MDSKNEQEMVRQYLAGWNGKDVPEKMKDAIFYSMVKNLLEGIDRTMKNQVYYTDGKGITKRKRTRYPRPCNYDFDWDGFYRKHGYGKRAQRLAMRLNDVFPIRLPRKIKKEMWKVNMRILSLTVEEGCKQNRWTAKAIRITNRYGRDISQAKRDMSKSEMVRRQGTTTITPPMYDM